MTFIIKQEPEMRAKELIHALQQVDPESVIYMASEPGVAHEPVHVVEDGGSGSVYLRGEFYL